LDALKARFSNLTVTCTCTLEEFYYGCKKSISFEKIELLGDGQKMKMVVVDKDIHVKPGMSQQTVLTYPGEGHSRPGQRPSDLVITFK